MARISGVDLPNDKRVEIGLTYIYGIGRTTATQIVEATGIDPDTRCRDLTEDQVSKIRDYIEKNLNVEGDLRRDRAFDIKRLIEIKLLSRYAPSSGPACKRTDLQEQRPHPQRSQEDHSKQEEISVGGYS